MCVKLHPENLNSGLYPSHPTSIYICGVTTVPKMRSSDNTIVEERGIDSYISLLKTLRSINHLNYKILDIFKKLYINQIR